MIQKNKEKEESEKNKQQQNQQTQQKKNKEEFAKNQVVIRFYYNILSKDYIVYAPNDKKILHSSKMLYEH